MSKPAPVSSAREEVRQVVPRLIELSAARIVKQVFSERQA